MKCLINYLGILTLSLLTLCVQAVTIHECVDDNNETTYQDNCPPGTESVKIFNLPVGKSEELQPETMLYVVPDCEACDITRIILKKHGLTNFTEVDIKYDKAAQSKLRKLLGSEGAVPVPTVILGEKKIPGFDKEKLINELEAAGFKEDVGNETGTEPKAEEGLDENESGEEEGLENDENNEDERIEGDTSVDGE